MDLLPVILSIAQAEDPPSVLGQIIRAIMTNEHVALARIWFLDQDHSCPVCGRAGEETALHMRASGGRAARNRCRLEPDRRFASPGSAGIRTKAGAHGQDRRIGAHSGYCRNPRCRHRP